jgi:hypothetical protein
MIKNINPPSFSDGIMDNESTNATNKLVQNTLQKLGIELNKYRTGKSRPL